MHRYVAARFTFRRLFLAGLTALLADAVGFGVLGIIDIPAIRGLALAAGIGVAVLIITNLVLLPVLLSYAGVSAYAAARSLSTGGRHSYARLFMPFCRPRGAAIALCVATALAVAVAGLALSTRLQIGDINPRAPELSADSRYNRDNGYVTGHYQLSTDQSAVIAKTPPDGIGTFKTLLEMDRLEEAMRDLPGVQTTISVASLARRYTAAGFEGDPRWMTINRDPFTVSDAAEQRLCGQSGIAQWRPLRGAHRGLSHGSRGSAA